MHSTINLKSKISIKMLTMKRFNDKIFFVTKRILATVVVLIANLVGAGAAWSYDGLTFWNIYKDNGWLNSGGYDFSSSAVNIGTTTSFFIKGFWVKGTFDSYDLDQTRFYYHLNGAYVNEYVVNGTWNKVGQYFYVEVSGQDICNLLGNGNIHNPGDNTLTLTVEAKKNGNVSSSNHRDVTFTLPGFTNTSQVTKDFGKKNRGSQPTSTVSYQHYGNTPTYTLENGSTISGYTANKDMFSVTSITNTGVTVKFNLKNTSLVVGSKYSAKLTLNDPHGKTGKVIILKGEVGYPYPTPVIADNPVLLNGPQATLSGYVKLTGCAVIDTAGFVIAPSGTTPGINQSTGALTGGKKYGIPITEYLKDHPNHTSKTSYEQTDLFQRTIYKYNGNYLTSGTTYNYKVYLHSTTAIDGKYWFLSDMGSFTVKSTCADISGDTIYYTIDNTREASLCELRFPTLAEAVADLKQTTTGHTAWLNGSKMLTKNVVFEVVNGIKAYGDIGTSKEDHPWDTSLSQINNANASCTSGGTISGGTPTYKLIVRAKDPNDRPTFGGLDLSNSRWITLKNLNIRRTAVTSRHDYSAIELGYYDHSDGINCNRLNSGFITNSDIEIIGCDIDATAFTCIHATGCDGLVLRENNFNLSIGSSADEANDRRWGASVKLISCKNVEFIRNSIKGSHATSLWIQHTQNMLVMNNVFWNNNIYNQNVAFIRPVMYDWNDNGDKRKVTKLGIYFNTLYLAEGTAKTPGGTTRTRSSEKVNFLCFGGEAQTTDTDLYDVANMHCMYNNFYSYDTQITGRTASDETVFRGQTLTDKFTDNNFWAEADASKTDETTTSGFAFGFNTKHVDVPDQVCGSTASKPDGLIIKGAGLNRGSKITTDISGLGIANTTYADRFKDPVRPEDGKLWTYGAFQKSSIEEIDAIVWTGSEDNNWDNRNNWATEDGEQVNCTHSFKANLKATIKDVKGKPIPEIKAWGTHVSGGSYVTDNPRGKYPDEYVEAGRAAVKAEEASITKYAVNLVLENGATIKGVENLYGDGTLRYDEVKGSFEVPRSKWVHIGSVIKPFDEGGPRNVRGEDLFMNEFPQVYLAKIQAGDDNLIKWNKTFESLYTEIGNNEAAAIRIPDQYGPQRLTAEEYYGDKSIATIPIEYTFWGRFNNEAARPTYTGLTADKIYPVSNTYPANIKVSELAEVSGLAAARIYVYTDKSSFETSNVSGAPDIIRSYQGFLIKPSTSGSIALPLNVFTDGSSTVNYDDLKSASLQNPFIALEANNISAKVGSVIQVTYDELKSDALDYDRDADKLFNNMEPNLPELYITEYNAKLGSVTVPTLSRLIPLGLRVRKAMYVSFCMRSTYGLSQALLIDTQSGKEYDLLDGNRYNFELAAGTYEGRFFLDLGASEEEESGIITDVESSNADNSEDIYIIDTNSGVVISSTPRVMLQSACITDMAGKTWSVELDNPHYNTINLVGAHGVYMITAIGDKTTKTEKVILK